ncbi:MAG TPA: type II secretion system protein GspE [Firmicutes bacterium]|mgnify:CR=1 FL=1|nr:type II secretion system protein GspE [Bacillota bacterium]
MNRTDSRYLGEILIEKGLISPEQLKGALNQQQKEGKYLGQILVGQGLVSEEEVQKVVAKQLGLDFLFPAEMEIHPDVLGTITAKRAQECRVIPIDRGVNWLRLACTDPLDRSLQETLRRELKTVIRWAVTTNLQINKALERFYHEQLHNVTAILEELSATELEQLSTSVGREIGDDPDKLVNEAPIVRMVNSIINEGIRLNASDIHLEPFIKGVRLRYRIDGVLYERKAPPLTLYPAVVSRLKLIAGMDITEKRFPQDGRITFVYTGRDLDLRVAVMPTMHGESAVVRILNRQNLSLRLENLGMEGILKRFERLINMTHGMILVSGPTGSGKTTTLYAVLSRLNKTERKIITIEDPVEYELTGVNQISVNPKLNFGFAQGVRTIVRHDPDIILVGEIRDLETAEVAIQSALTGHLVFSTVHTNDAAGTFTRLIDMGIEEYLVTSTVRGVLAQRLVRKICPECKEEYQPTAMERDLLAQMENVPPHFYHGVGCEKCNLIGYKGQTGLFELLIPSEEIEGLVMNRASSSTIKKQALKEGMHTLRRDGLEKVSAGVTTISEVLRVT